MDVKKLIEEVLTDLGNNKTLTDVASKIQIIVRLLGDEKLRSWYNCEFVTGYHDEELPDYRKSRAADIKADYLAPQWNGILSVPGQSVPVHNLGKEKYDEIMTIEIKDNISSIVEFSKHSDQMAMTLSPYEMGLVQDVLKNAQIQRVHKVVPPSVFQYIIDNVQNRIIDMFMDINEKLFNGELDVTSSSGKKEITHVINNYITAGVVNTGSGSINASNSTNTGNINNPMSDDVRIRLNTIASEIEKIASDHDDWLKDISQELLDIHEELKSPSPQPGILAKSFKALLWGVSVGYKASIESLVGEAVKLLMEKQ